jgi:ATP-binding cassette subfamily C exporter for protease/lipase
MFALAWTSHRLTAPLIVSSGEATAETNAYLTSKLRNAETVEAMGMLGNFRRHWLTLHERMLSRQEIAFERGRRIQAVVKVVQNSQQSLILTAGALLVIDGQIGVGAMIACNALLGNALRPMTSLVATWKLAIDARQAYARLEAMLDANPERPDGHTTGEVRGQIELRHLVAKVPGGDAVILHDLCAEFKAGEVIGIVGPSGAGKSTLARCLVGIWPGANGGVLIDGVPIEKWSRSELGPHLGYLPQDIEMLDGTIAENIARFGAVDPGQVIDAATRTGIHDMVLRFPKGYDTPMGEAGGLMSGGQRQRIGLARAIYGNPTLVVLDEPNANLDDVGEAALVRAVRELKAKGKTVFMIVHQLNLLAVADRVLVLDGGHIDKLAAVVVQTEATKIEAKA